MKRPVLVVLALAIIGFAVYFLIFKKDKKNSGPKDKPIAMGEHTDVFNQSFNKLLTAYMSVKDALVLSDTAKVNVAASSLITSASELKTDEIKGDTNGIIKATAIDFVNTVSASAKTLLTENDLEAKRKEFKIISETMWSLTRTVKYNGQKVYYQYCPMAFNNQGANWISNDLVIKNPYFGDAMLECGSVEDSLDYSKK
ncbi:MAG: DUF3347 domain-containing protein [Chitinophagaceae bacterium]|nr:DUF3347 domain-containing protein [Chitinophagaceae bacterium]